jgi:sugar phosphate permease
VAAGALIISGIVLTLAGLTHSAVGAAVMIALAAGIADLSISPAWAMCHDVGGEAAGTVTATMNTFANVGGALAPIVMGYAVQWWSSWTLPIVLTGVVYVAGGLLAILIDPRKTL